MNPSPYSQIRILQARHRRQASPLDWLVGKAGPVLLGLLAMPFVSPLVPWVFESTTRQGLQGLGGFALRLSLLACGAGLLSAHGAVLRGEDRAVLDLHPISPSPLVKSLLWREALDNLPTALGIASLLLPLAGAGRGLACTLSVFLVLEGWLLGTALGVVTQLGGVWAARHPGLEKVLEALRGGNPRMQAALIYAPGVAVGLAGMALYVSSSGLVRVLEGDLMGLAAFPVPLVLSLVGLLLSPHLADRMWFEAGSVLSEVDAAYSSKAAGRDEPNVYLEWLVPRLPILVRPHALRGLRQGWRGLRTWAMAAWAAGFLAAIGGWSEAADAPASALLVGACGLILVAAMAIRMEINDPEWTVVLPGSTIDRLLGRFFVVFAYAQGVILPPLATVLLRHGASATRLWLYLEGLALAASALSTILSPYRNRAWLGYAPLAVLVGIIAVRWGS